MARKYEVTRTIENTTAVALVFDKTLAEAENVTVTVPGRYNADDNKLAKIVNKMFEGTSKKFIEVVSATSANKTYGITLDDFMAHAVELDPKTRQPIEG